MPFIVITPPAIGEPTRVQSFAQPAIDDLNFLDSLLASTAAGIGILNGSFELGAGADTAPSSWALAIASNNHTAFETSAGNTRHGYQAFSMTNSTGATGGATLTSLDFVACDQDHVFVISWLMKTSVATTTNTVQIKWYTEAEALISTQTLYTASAGNPTSWTAEAALCTPPAGAKLFKVVIIGVNSTVNGTTYWDGFLLTTANNNGSVIVTSSGDFTAIVPLGCTALKYTAVGGGAGGCGGGGDNAAPATAGAGQDSWIFDSSHKARGGAIGTGGDLFGTGTPGAAGAGVAPAFASGVVKTGTTAGGGGGAGASPVSGNGGSATGLNSLFLNSIASGGNGGSGNTGLGTGGAGVAGQANTGQGGGGGGGCNGGGGGGPGAPGECAIGIISVVPGQVVSGHIGAGGGAGPGGLGPSGSTGGAGGAGGSGFMLLEFL